MATHSHNSEQVLDDPFSGMIPVQYRMRLQRYALLHLTIRPNDMPHPLLSVFAEIPFTPGGASNKAVRDWIVCLAKIAFKTPTTLDVRNWIDDIYYDYIQYCDDLREQEFSEHCAIQSLIDCEK